MSEYEIDWSNIDLTDSYQRDLNMLDPYSFDVLLLEISTNIPIDKLTRLEIVKHFNKEIENKVAVAREVFMDNLNNIHKQAKAER